MAIISSCSLFNSLYFTSLTWVCLLLLFAPRPVYFFVVVLFCFLHIDLYGPEGMYSVYAGCDVSVSVARSSFVKKDILEGPNWNTVLSEQEKFRKSFSFSFSFFLAILYEEYCWRLLF